MKNCQKIKKMFIEAIYNELATINKSILEKHLENCSSCKTEFLGMEQTLNQMENYKRPALEPEYWDRYWSKLESRIIKEKSKKSFIYNIWNNFLEIFSWQMPGYYRISVAVSLVLIGIFIGKTYFSTDNTESSLTRDTFTDTDNLIPENNIVRARAERYLERSKLILMGIVNYDTEEHSNFVPDLSRQKEISRQLIREAAVLKEDLLSPEQKALRKLISDLEVIFLQIANLEEQYDLDAVELIQGGIERKSVLFKINLEEILSNKSTKPKVNNFQSDKSKKKL